ncbi:Maleylacetate reductase 2 (plasmid) [Rhodococcus opacus]|uniref:Maleylacetate reductase 2 n=1 Tax=Rhodococcus opacus TaxID=37919 RepID=A0A1B1KI15_RHOOP|nr:maleylacetate reductase [Rhodococcus opacus]ANS32255.1 Maleylacetate reductase 2 [Rhodococcus opacus]ANS32348.1 Maleylacetate reductase 2 [Rhodococcus opacus]
MPIIDPVAAPSGVTEFVHEWPASRVVFGAGRIAAVAGETGRYGTRAIMINTAAARRPAGWLADCIGEHVVARITEVVQHVPVAAVDAAVSTARDTHADVVVCIGGGSATGLAKGIARELDLPIVAVPTTYAGSEMTSIWGLTDKGAKTTGRDPVVRPRTVVYDPELTVDLPAPLTVTSGINATAHCVEALYASDSSPLAQLVAAEGIRSISTALPVLLDTPNDLGARAIAMRGAWLAGWSLEVSTTGLHHKLCHVLGGLLDLPHSPLHTVLLPYAVAHMAPAAPAQTQILLQSLGLDGPLFDAGGLIWEHHRALRTATSLRDIGMRHADLDRAVDMAAAALANSTPSPRPASAKDVRHLITAAWKGQRPASA